jgi:hypothetical protein
MAEEKREKKEGEGIQRELGEHFYIFIVIIYLICVVEELSEKEFLAGYYIRRVRNFYIIEKIENLFNAIDDAFERSEEGRERKRKERGGVLNGEIQIEIKDKDEIQKEEEKKDYRL